MAKVFKLVPCGVSCLPTWNIRQFRAAFAIPLLLMATMAVVQVETGCNSQGKIDWNIVESDAQAILPAVESLITVLCGTTPSQACDQAKAGLAALVAVIPDIAKIATDPTVKQKVLDGFNLAIKAFASISALVPTNVGLMVTAILTAADTIVTIIVNSMPASQVSRTMKTPRGYKPYKSVGEFRAEFNYGAKQAGAPLIK